MRLLVINHFFEQDIDALAAGAEQHELHVISYRLFYEEARRFFPRSVFGRLEEFTRPEHAGARAAYAARVRALMLDLYDVFPFDVVVSPSDAFFYVRAAIEAAHELGVPFVVAQKETTISPGTMQHHSVDVARHSPFIADLMLVCSHRHREFWLRAGSAPEKVLVTGQPRFDVYARPEQRRDPTELGLPFHRGRRHILFLSYDTSAYIEGAGGEDTGFSWDQLKAETEEALLRVVATGQYALWIKPHPQQDAVAEQARFAASAQRDYAHVLERRLDTRQLILNADMVVGFQSTAVFEAMAAGKPVVYTFWTSPAEQFAPSLIPFHEMGHVLRCVTSPDELVAAVTDRDGTGVRRDDELRARRMAVVEEHLGPFDGHATERVLAEIERYVGEYRARAAHAGATRLRRRRPWLNRAVRRLIAAGQVGRWAAAERALSLLWPAWPLVYRVLRPGRALDWHTPAYYRELFGERRRDAAVFAGRSAPRARR